MSEQQLPQDLTSRHRRLASSRWFREWRRRHGKLIGRVGWTLFLGGLAVGFLSGASETVLQWFGITTDPRLREMVGQIAAGAVFAGIGCGLLYVTDPEEKLAQPTSERLQEVMKRFEGLDVLLKQLTTEVEEMTVNSLELERRAKEADALLRLSREEKDALVHEWDRRDKASSRRDLLLFAAGLAAGVLTNFLIP